MHHITEKKQEKRRRGSRIPLYISTTFGKTFKIQFLVNEGLMDMSLMNETDEGKDYQNFRNHYQFIHFVIPCE